MPSANRAGLTAPLVDPTAVARFGTDLARLDPGSAIGRFGIAVSGGPDSMALLRLAAAHMPGRVEAATVDHGLRATAAGEAAMVAAFCATLGVPHAILTVRVEPGASVQAAARRARYAALGEWARDRAIGALLTAHHADDQAETLMMRLARGAGTAGLAGIRDRRDLGGVLLLRPLLGWRRAELAAIVRDVATVDDPSNADPHHDRTHVRALLAGNVRIDSLRLAASAAHLAESEAALEWVADEAIRSRCAVRADGAWTADLDGLPRAIRWRALAKLIAAADSPAAGSTVDHALERLDRGEIASIGRLKITPGRSFLLERATGRR
jgi:tRNA(Ile)-lysidine synthase